MAGVKVSVGADTSKASKELKSFEKKTKGIAASIAKGFKERVGHKLFDGLIAASAQLPEIFNHAVNTASDLNEEISKGEVIFGGASKEIRKFTKSSVASLGLSEVAAMEAAGQFGNLFKTMGMGQSDVSNMSQEMAGLAADLGSFHNTSTEDAITAIGAALRGESEPIRRYGVLLDDATLKAEAYAKGIYDGTGSLKPATRALAAYSVILKQTGDAQGDFARTSDGLAGQKKILAANIENLATKLGQEFLPVMKDMVSTINEIDFTPAIQGLAGFGAEAGRVFEVLFGAEDSMKKAFEPVEAKDMVGASDEEKSLFSKDFQKKIAEEEVKISNAAFRLKLKQEETLANKVKNANEEERKKLNTIKQVREEYAKTLKILDARITGDKKLLEQEKLRGEIEAEQKLSEKNGIRLDEKSAEKIVMRRREAESAEENREKEKKAAIAAKQERVSVLQLDIDDIGSQLDSARSRSSLAAVSSMQRIGGGGGVYGELDLQKRQTDLQAKMVDLLQELKNESAKAPLSEF